MRQIRRRKEDKDKQKRFRFVSFYVFLVVLILFWFFNSSKNQASLRSFSKYGRIDVVYTFVNGSDPIWIAAKQEVELRDSETHAEVYSGNFASSNRFRSSNELMYSLRSLEKYAPWINNVFLVVATKSQVPVWVDTQNPRIHIIYHEDIFNDKSHLPTFSSAAIESNLDNIPGISENFIYFNDDIFLGKPVSLTDFISDDRIKIYLAWTSPGCAENCYEEDLGNGICNLPCNTTMCSFDLGDCSGDNIVMDVQIGVYDSEIEQNECVKQGCFLSWLGDSMCDAACDNKYCGFDAGDCDVPLAEIAIEPVESLVHLYILPFAVVSLPFSDLSPVTEVEFNTTAVYFSRVIEEVDQNYLFLLFNASALTNSSTFSAAIWNDEGDTLTFSFADVVNETSIMNLTLIKDMDAENETKSVDSFSSSLLFTKKALREKLPGFSPFNRVIAHTPHFLNKKHLKAMKHVFSEEFDQTSSNKFRASTDMQFALSYFNFVVSQSDTTIDIKELFDIFDSDKNGELSYNELKTVLLATGEVDIGSLSSLDGRFKLNDFAQNLVSDTFFAKYFGQMPTTNPDIDTKTFSESSSGVTISAFVTESFKRDYLPSIIRTLEWDSKHFEYVLESDDISFNMLVGNDLDTQIDKLDKLRINTPKFFCINDDISSLTISDAFDEKALFQEFTLFLEYLYPKPSVFEKASSHTTSWRLVNSVGFEKLLLGLGFLSFLFWLRGRIRKKQHEKLV